MAPGPRPGRVGGWTWLPPLQDTQDAAPLRPSNHAAVDNQGGLRTLPSPSLAAVPPTSCRWSPAGRPPGGYTSSTPVGTHSGGLRVEVGAGCQAQPANPTRPRARAPHRVPGVGCAPGTRPFLVNQLGADAIATWDRRWHRLSPPNRPVGSCTATAGGPEGGWTQGSGGRPCTAHPHAPAWGCLTAPRHLHAASRRTPGSALPARQPRHFWATLLFLRPRARGQRGSQIGNGQGVWRRQWEG